MVGTRWQRTLVLCLGLFLMGQALPVSATDDVLPDLRLSDLVLGPSASVVRGSLIRVEALLSLDGSPLIGNIRVEISWRRLDKQEPCGTTWETVASDSVGWSTTVDAWIDTSELVSGDYEIVIAVDPDNWIPESNETNNHLVTNLVIRSPQPELHPVRLEPVPAVPLAWGESATLRTAIENSGDLAAGSFHVEFALLPIAWTDPSTGERWNITPVIGQSETGSLGNWTFGLATEVRSLADAVNAIPSDAWVPFSVLQIPGLARDQSVELTGVLSTGEWLRTLLTTAVVNGTLDSSIMTPFSADEMKQLQDGVTTYAIRVSIRELVGTAEQDTANNELVSALSVEPSVLELPELLPVSASFDQDLPLAWDDDVDVEVVVTNRGGSSAPTIFGSTSITVSFSYRKQGATAWIPLEIKTIPQLGAEDDTDTDSVDIRIDARPSQLNLSPGSYELRIVVDEANLIAERNEHNNELIVGFSVQGTELHPVSLDLPPEPIHQGDTITVSALIENTGERSQRDFTVGFYIDDMRFDTFYYQAASLAEDGLEEDDRARVQGILDTTDLPPETYSIRVIVDPDDHVLEFDEGNNVIQSTLKLFPPEQRLAELHITQIEYAPTSPIPADGSLQISVTLRNDGNIAAETFQVELELLYSPDGQSWSTPVVDTTGMEGDDLEDASFVRTQSIYGLSRAEKTVVREAFSTQGWPIGFYKLRVRVDPATVTASQGEIPEMDDFNNEAMAAFSIGTAVETNPTSPAAGQPFNLPNLVFQDVMVSPASAVGIGASVTFSASIVNTGTQPSGSFAVTLQWTTPTGASYTLMSQRVDNLSPGQAWRIPSSTIQTSLPMGSYAIIGILDVGNEIAESNEVDNELNVAITVGQGQGIQPDLTPIAVRFVPSTASVQAGQEVLVYTTIQNAGALAAGPFTVEVSMGDIVSRETWPGLEPLASIELVHTLGTPVAGTYTVNIDVDSRGQVLESNESNNNHSEQLQIAAMETIAVERVIGDQGSVIAMALDSATGNLYAAWSGGAVRATDRKGGSLSTYTAGVGLTKMVTILGVQDIGYVATTDGRILAIDLSAGKLLMESETLETGIRDLIQGPGGTLYVAMQNQVLQLSSALMPVAQAVLDGEIVQLGYDPVLRGVYAITTAGLYALSSDLIPQCSVADIVGTPTTLAIGDTGVFVGTSNGILRTFTFCQRTGNSGMMMLDAWRYPRSGSFGSAITSITIDARDVDPIYVATAGGVIQALDFTGNSLWSYQRALVGIHAIPVIDPRSGRIFYADDAGVPTILDADGSVALSIDSQMSQGSAAGSNLIIDEVRRQTESGMRLFRLYYFGADDGWIYKTESIR